MDKYYDNDAENKYSTGDTEETEENLEFDDLSDEYNKYANEIKESLAIEEELGSPFFDKDENDDEFSYEDTKSVLKSKKYVIQIYPDNVDFIEEMETEDRNDYINGLITENVNKSYEENETKKVSHSIQQIIVIILTIIVGLPIIFYLINLSLTLTSNSYKGVQMNFEKLYMDRGRLSR